MARKPYVELILEAAIHLSKEKGTFTRKDIIEYICKIDPNVNTHTINPMIQGVTENAPGGAPGAVGRDYLYRVGPGKYIYNGNLSSEQLKSHKPNDIRPTTLPHTQSSQARKVVWIEVADDQGLSAIGYECPNGYSGYEPEDCKKCPIRVDEDPLKEILLAGLQMKEWNVELVAWGHQAGIDIVARHPRLGTINIEAKGEGTRYQMRRNYFKNIIGQITQRMDKADEHYAIALPAYKQFISLIQHYPLKIRQQLALQFFLVKRGDVEDTVYHIKY